MKRVLRTMVWAVCLGLLVPAAAMATNGDNLIGVGSISRSMGGVGIAAPQDSISAVFANPAAMCFSNFCPSSEVDFMGTLFVPSVKGRVSSGPFSYSADSKGKVYPIPALGISFGFDSLPNWRFGLGAYGVSGLGVDYRGTSLSQGSFFGPGAPLAAGTMTDLTIMKFAPTAAVQLTDWLSLGASLHIDYSTLDLGQGVTSGFGWGLQVGAIVKPTSKLSLGLTYVMPQNISYNGVADFNGDGINDNLQLESPNTLGFGVAYEFVPNKFLVETNVKWLNWSNAKGYKDFDWSDQWVFSIGAQYKPIDRLTLRVGYNYGASPVKTHSGFVGSSMVGVQGIAMPRYYYETFRIIGFPAVAEHHITVGVAYDITDKFSAHIGFMHAFENSVSETGTNLAGMPTQLKSTMSQNSYEIGLTWRF